ncbi:hypothetical protein BJ508DRAFT_308881 [Ascobolus immersus RN42]|uniref:Uncharacterized protein n=1 Tax=Ascobolus immersus RN42 TaxID=1160509 RepID=A0A3N4HYR2_ASCIM|nr:hypothetical protein BJ508DRAFT_308881 [Ascobolus immersus RN42]
MALLLLFTLPHTLHVAILLSLFYNCVSCTNTTTSYRSGLHRVVVADELPPLAIHSFSSTSISFSLVSASTTIYIDTREPASVTMAHVKPSPYPEQDSSASDAGDGEVASGTVAAAIHGVSAAGQNHADEPSPSSFTTPIPRTKNFTTKKDSSSTGVTSSASPGRTGL